jgi:hypothetical protein
MSARGRVNLKATRVDGCVAKVAVSKTTFLPNGDVDGARQGHKRARGREGGERERKGEGRGRGEREGERKGG